jgi:transglutaminase/protease-like cytokinesis protein 3
MLAVNNTYFRYYEEIDMYISHIYSTSNEDSAPKTEYTLNTRGSRLTYQIGENLKKRSKKIRKKYVKKSMSKKQKAKAIAKGVSKQFKYKVYRDSDILGSTYANLKKNKAYCHVYSYLFRDTCIDAGLPCDYIMGMADGGSHAWNRVKIGKKWYYYDVTYYDSTKYSKYLGAKKNWRSHRPSRYYYVSKELG